MLNSISFKYHKNTVEILLLSKKLDRWTIKDLFISIKEEEEKKAIKRCYERTLITIANDPNDVTFKKVFNIKPRPRYPKKVKCTITNLPAKYIDPLTCLPYHNSHCFRMIREAYYQQLEIQGDRNNTQVAEWIKWYFKNKDKMRRYMRPVKEVI